MGKTIFPCARNIMAFSTVGIKWCLLFSLDFFRRSRAIHMITINNKYELRDLILDGITTEELNSKYDYSSITNMSYMFNACKSLKTIPLIDTSNVTNMKYMFSFCHSLETIPLIDTSNVTNMIGMFENCKSLETIPLIDTSNVTSMNGMFYRCESLETIPLLDTSKVTCMSYMFKGCDNLINIDPFNFHLYDFSTIKNELFRKKYPELFI